MSNIIIKQVKDKPLWAIRTMEGRLLDCIPAKTEEEAREKWEKWLKTPMYIPDHS